MFNYNNNCTLVKQYIRGYTQMIERYIDTGWDVVLMSFMFKQLPGNDAAVIRQMADEVDRVYSTFVTRAFRNPKSCNADSLPFLVGAPDLPVWKNRKQTLKDFKLNNGQHMHGILAMPPTSRLKTGIVQHFQVSSNIYAKNRLLRISVEPIESNLDLVVDYVFKSLKNGHFGCDDISVYPKARTER